MQKCLDIHDEINFVHVLKSFIDFTSNRKLIPNVKNEDERQDNDRSLSKQRALEARFMTLGLVGLGTGQLCGKLKKNSSNNLLDGNQDMLKERDLKLRGRKDNGANGDEDYDESGASQTKCTTATTSMTMVIVTLVLCFHHRHPQLQILHPA
ncbi:hypothetical protein PV325_011258 [Microctonus aethiopoides]|nr:hypothetical protein PV325_011258 [Microctonus aethiopoides]KAK0093382.1 hypothetical protein PV326_013622 [Microctonus aethiopoides]